MKGKSLTCGMVAAGLLLLGAWPAWGNLITNSGFELQGATPATALGWNHIAINQTGNTAVSARTDSEPYAGNWHLQLSYANTSSPAGGPVAEAQYQTATGSVTPGDLYDLSFLAKQVGSMGIGTVVRGQVHWLDSDGSHGGGVKGTSPEVVLDGNLSGSYQLFTLPGIQAAADSDAALVILRVIGGAVPDQSAVVYFDNVALVPEPASLGLVGLGAVLMVRRRRL